jgi:outer membrane receptor for ferrienterochelin and colicin
MRRMPGVNVLNDQGEGRFVSVRGLDPELNATSLNGVRLPAPESDVRSVALDVISSDIIE